MSKYTDFTSHIKQAGIARNNRFEIIFSLPQKLNSLLSSSIEQSVGSAIYPGSLLSRQKTSNQIVLSIRTEGAEFPSNGILTQEDNNVGRMIKKPYALTHDDITFRFLCSSNLIEKIILDEWMNLAINKNNKKASFYSSYTSDIIINQLDGNDRVTYSVTLKEAYPINITAMPLNKNDVDTVHKLTGQFTYRIAVETNRPETQKETTNNRLVTTDQNNIFGDIHSISSALSVLESESLNFISGIESDAFSIVSDILNDSGIPGPTKNILLRELELDTGLSDVIKESISKIRSNIEGD